MQSELPQPARGFASNNTGPEGKQQSGEGASSSPRAWIEKSPESYIALSGLVVNGIGTQGVALGYHSVAPSGRRTTRTRGARDRALPPARHSPPSGRRTTRTRGAGRQSTSARAWFHAHQANLPCAPGKFQYRKSFRDSGTGAGCSRHLDHNVSRVFSGTIAKVGGASSSPQIRMEKSPAQKTIPAQGVRFHTHQANLLCAPRHCIIVMVVSRFIRTKRRGKQCRCRRGTCCHGVSRFIRANGAFQASPGQRPGYRKPTRFSPERAVQTWKCATSMGKWDTESEV